MLILTDLIESEFKMLGISSRGTEALMPEALGTCCPTRYSIFDDTAFSAPIAAMQKRATTEVVAITVSFLRFTLGRLHRKY